MESEPPYLYVRGNPVNLIDPSGMNPPSCSDDPTQICYDPPIGPGTSEFSTPPPVGPIGKIYDGELRPLFQEVIRSIDAGWRLEKNLFGNDRYQDGLVRFGRHFLAIAIPGTRPMPLGFNNPNDSNLIVVPSSYRTVIHFQGFMNILDTESEFAYRFNFANGNPESFGGQRPGTTREYLQLKIFLSGYAYYSGGSNTIPAISGGNNPRTGFLWEAPLAPAPERPYPGAPLDEPLIIRRYPGIGTVAGSRTRATALGRLGAFGQAPPIGRRAYQVLIQESQNPLVCTPVGRWRIIIQTYQLWISPQRERPEIRRNHLSISPNGIILIKDEKLHS